jgi:hypothetical protein
MAYTPIKIDPLPGTVNLYQRHLCVCTGQADWPEHIEKDGAFMQALAEAITRRAADMPSSVKLTACSEPSAAGYDLLVFPDNIRYLGLQEADLPTLVETHLVGNQLAATLPHQPLTGQYVFVCVHTRRDVRCGECGPTLITAFTQVLAERGLSSPVTVRATSHLGGHKYAGNVIIYPGGDWYGYVTPADVPRLVEQHLEQGQLVADLWRGRMGLSPEAQQELIAGSTPHPPHR